MKKPNQRVVITGMGVLSPNGNSLDAFWQNTLGCVSGIGEITRFDTTDFPAKIAGEIKEFDLARYIPSSYKFKKNRLGMHTQYAIATTHMALRHAKLSLDELKTFEPVSLFIGVSTSAIDMIEKGKEALIKKGPRRVSPYTVSACQPHAVVSEIVESLQVQSRRTTISSACPSGLEAIGNAMLHIRSGQGNLAICGGVDSPITPLTMASFDLTGMILSKAEDPTKCSRPFDAKRQGGVLSEGGGIFILESLESALARGAEPLAEICGFGNYSDNVGSPSGSGLLESMQSALDDAAMMPQDIEYINAHGPGHPVIDVTETHSIKQVFGKRAYQLPISSIKGVIGNPLAAAGGLQAAACVMAMREGILPPTANYETPDPDCDLNYIPNLPMKAPIRNAMINLHGLGGGNISLILRKVRR
ncbi:beta-ketoacyl-[acyl-carrier-protein] synthase family protein [Kiritimatiellaeota bacterium B1221]|nr:beta-ketoacyl-[acyl-carrier-protein] synthase family protein [Kiritimatiellaeota bacterium B1221]